MIEETGRIVATRDEYAWVEIERATACGSCAARSGCGTSVLAKLFGRRQTNIRVVNSIGAADGDRVVIGISESGLVRGSLAVYAVPLAGLFAGGLAGQYLGVVSGSAHADLASIPGAAAGFAAGIGWLKRFSRVSARDGRYQPVILRRQHITPGQA